MTRAIVIVVGHEGAGKSTASRYLADEFDGVVINIGDVISTILEAMGISVHDRSSLGATLESRHLITPLLSLLSSQIERAAGLVILDGVRLHEVESLAIEKAKDVIRLHIRRGARELHHSPYLRFIQEFETRASIAVLNDGTLEELRSNVTQSLRLVLRSIN